MGEDVLVVDKFIETNDPDVLWSMKKNWRRGLKAHWSSKLTGVHAGRTGLTSKFKE